MELLRTDRPENGTYFESDCRSSCSSNIGSLNLIGSIYVC